jgi:hypothetical protein
VFSAGGKVGSAVAAHEIAGKKKGSSMVSYKEEMPIYEEMRKHQGPSKFKEGYC